jgi:hypothetical protein
MLSTDEIASVLSPDKLEAGLGIPSPGADRLSALLADTPENLKHMAHYALAWGVGDDIDRSQFVARADSGMQRNLKWVVDTHDDAFDDWLAGDEAKGRLFTTAYLAFTNMRMAADELP